MKRNRKNALDRSKSRCIILNNEARPVRGSKEQQPKNLNCVDPSRIPYHDPLTFLREGSAFMEDSAMSMYEEFVASGSLFEKLNMLCEKEGIDRSKFLRDAIVFYIDNKYRVIKEINRENELDIIEKICEEVVDDYKTLPVRDQIALLQAASQVRANELFGQSL